MSDPKLLWMDEPSMELSPMMVEEVGKIIGDINQSNKSIMLVEQKSRLALRLANKANILEVGRIVLEGTAQEIANDDCVKKV
jgi:branched-chain amino acid transport system ATP-binding protein